MKVLLVNPSYEYPVVKTKGIKRFGRIWPPLELLNIASLLLQKGIEVDILDANALKIENKKVVKIGKKYDKVFITSSPLDRWQCPFFDLRNFEEISKDLSEFTDVYLMGFYPSLNPKQFIERTKAKGVIVGEPELSVLEILEGKKNVEGVYSNGRFIPRKNFLDLNSLPILPYEKLPLKMYKYELLDKNFFLFEASRGCPYNCFFCAKNVMYSNYRIKNAENVIKDIDEAYKKHKIKNGYFIDLEFNTKLNEKNVEKISLYLKERKYDFKWACQTRVDTVNYDILKKMKLGGCDLIHFGIESGSARIMKINGKGINKKQVEKAVKNCNKLGIRTVGFFMFGFYKEKLKDMIKTIEFAKKLKLTYASFHIATPYPNTKFYEIVKDYINEKNPFVYEYEVSLENIKKIISFAYKKFYLRPKSIKSLISSGDFLGKISLFLNFSQEE